MGEAGQRELLRAGAAADVGAPSNTSTPMPARANVTAAAKPLGPDPTTTASTGSMDRRYGTERRTTRQSGGRADLVEGRLWNY